MLKAITLIPMITEYDFVADMHEAIHYPDTFIARQVTGQFPCPMFQVD
jgi:hypothetical protein